MFNDIGPLEVVTLALLAAILVGPDKLPKMVSDTARALRKVRQISQSAQASIRDELPPELKDLNLEDLNPKTLVTRHLLNDASLSFDKLAADLDLEGEASRSPAAKASAQSAGPGSIDTTGDHRN
ncbi:Sec-independent protein translocase subunit TatB [Streptomyces chiangmaiensis]|uniref:Sec-independent protein translocase subunit TatB n=1 Tax=Streptomyces chiangmaiensis TaxID=766497 RepID=A0ABU7FT50_9ACTN|nr:Sec-independent protein translocase subunit TatB [Streptomyces chiangmaiensis]MED7827249.1 Sec-independent protein translocase subunit TatB [Streptomyces chiangmaiensis]